MTSIPFIEARFFDPTQGRFELETRLKRHLRQLRLGRIPPSLLVPPEEITDAIGSAERDLMNIITSDDEARIKRRAKRILDCRKAVSGLEHLKLEDRTRLEVLKNGAQLISIPSEHRADELAAALHEDMPWMAPATEEVWHAMRRSVREGWSGLRVPPLLLDGPPGIGKSHWARRLGEVLATPTTVIEATGENASFGVAGSQRGWGGSYPGRLLETALRSRIANPVMIVDEVEKAGLATSTKGHAFGLAEALLPLLEPLTATHWSCPYYQVKFDMSWVIWVLTSNDYRLLPGPLLSRCPPIHLRPLTSAELLGFVRREGERRTLSEAAIEAICEALKHRSPQRHHPSLRMASRMLQRAVDLDNAPVLH